MENNNNLGTDAFGNPLKRPTKEDIKNLLKRKEPIIKKRFTIADLVNNGKAFYSNQKDNDGKDIGVADSLKRALEYAGKEGVVASLPYLIAGKAKAGNDNYLWRNWSTALSEEDIGVDKKGKFVKAGKPVVIIVHGGGILDYNKMIKAYIQGLIGKNVARYADNEFNALLNGILSGNQKIQMYTIDDVRKGNIEEPFGMYAVALDFEAAKATKSGWFKKKEFMENPLVLARAGTLDYLEEYFNKAKVVDETVGNRHRLKEIDPQVPQGRFLFVGGRCDGGYGGLDGGSVLDNDGRFVGVARRR